jgi:hypothetical protein
MTALAKAIERPRVGQTKIVTVDQDAGGWIRMDGRAKSSLTSTQQTAATSLGIGANLPDLRNKSMCLTRASGQQLVAGGSETKTITQASLPNVNLTGGDHNHTVSDPGHTHGPSSGYAFMGFNPSGYGVNVGSGGGYPGDASGSINATSASLSINSSGALSLPLGGSGAALDVRNPFIALVTLIYLGV